MKNIPVADEDYETDYKKYANKIVMCVLLTLDIPKPIFIQIDLNKSYTFKNTTDSYNQQIIKFVFVEYCKKVILKIFQDDKLVSTIQKDTSKGMVTFNISSAYYKAKKYRFEISSLGITQKTQTKSYDHN